MGGIQATLIIHVRRDMLGLCNYIWWRTMRLLPVSIRKFFHPILCERSRVIREQLTIMVCKLVPPEVI